jgi:hypothetical protein
VSAPQQSFESTVDFRAALCASLFWDLSKIHIRAGFRLDPKFSKLLGQQV